MDDFINVIKKDSQIRVKINDMLDKLNRLPCNYQLKIGCDNLIRNVIVKELINIMATTITDLDIELKMKNSRIKYLEDKTRIIIFYIYKWRQIKICFNFQAKLIFLRAIE